MIWDMICHHLPRYIMRYHHLSRYIMRYHTGSSQNTRQKQPQRKPTTLLRSSVSFCFFVSALFFSCLVFRLAFIVVLLLSISWAHHRTDRTTSKQQPCPLTTRSATRAHVFVSFFIFYFPSFRLFFLLVNWYQVLLM